MNIEAVVYVARKLGWTREEIGKLTPKQFVALVDELHYQESIEDYNRAFQTASILAAIYNTIPSKRGSRVFKYSDFLTAHPPERINRKTPKQPEFTLEDLARQEGIKLPKRG